MSHTRKTCALFALAIATLPAASRTVAAPAETASVAVHTHSVQAKPRATRAMTRRGTIMAATRHAGHPQPHGMPVLADVPGTPRIQLASVTDAVAPIPLMPALSAPAPSHRSSIRASVGNPSTITEEMRTGESQILDFDGITTTAVGDPSIADIVPLSTRRLLINAKAPGSTTIFVFDARGKNTITVNVTPGTNFGPIAERIEKDIDVPTVTVRAINDTIFLEGSVPTQSDSDLAMAIATAYTPKVKNLLVTPEQPHVASLAEKYADLLNDNLSSAGVTAKVVDDTTIALTGKYAIPVGAPTSYGANFDTVEDAGNAPLTTQAINDPLSRLVKSLPPELKVINLIDFNKEATKQILVRAKIIDIDRTATRSFGLNWGTANATLQQVGTTNTTQEIVQFQTQPILFAQALGSQYTNLLGGGGPLTRTFPFATQLNALIQENKARVLSQPSLLVLDGSQGNMLVGGEFPVPVASGNGAYSVFFKPYGIRLNVAPTVIGDDTVQLTVTPEVSDLDFSNAVTYNGGSIPAISVRRATSTLQMKDGTTLVIGGLYTTNFSNNVSRIPYLSNIPILGEFFKNTSKQKIERELLVLIEAEIVKPDTAGVQPPAPGSLENMDIHKPYVPRKEFDKEFPDIQNFPHQRDPETPKTPISLPATSPDSAGK